MSNSKWRWTSECDNVLCPGSCDFCDMEYKSELDKLEGYLRKNKIEYQRIEETLLETFNGETEDYGRHQIVVYDSRNKKLFDVICQHGSFGYEDGLLEAYGDAVVKPYDTADVVGWLTADEVIARFECRE